MEFLFRKQLNKKKNNYGPSLRSLVFICSIVIFCFGIASKAYATTYYIDSVSGLNTNSGTSSSTPWQTISKVNSSTFNSGDNILFQAGETFNGTIQLTASSTGTSSTPITFGSYGIGRATINSATNTGFLAHNTAGLVVRDLVFTGSGANTNTGHGIEFLNDLASTTLHYIDVNDVDVSGYYGIGVAVIGNNGNSGYSDITIQSSTVHDNGDTGVEVIGSNFSVRNIFTNVLVDHIVAYNNTGQNTSNPVGPDFSAPAGSGIFLQNVDGGTIQFSEAYNNGASGAGGIGIWAATSNNITIQFNESHNNHSTGSDGGGFDFDGGMTNSVMQYNYSHDNTGAGFLEYEWYGTPGPPSWSNNTTRYNISQNDGSSEYYGSVAIGVGDPSQQMTGMNIYNNTFYNNNGTSSAIISFEISNGTNLAGTIANNIFYSATSGTPLIDGLYGNYSGISFRGNDYFGGGPIRWNGTSYPTMAAWQSSTTQEEIGGVNVGLISDPKLVAAGGGSTIHGYNPSSVGQYRLQSSSPMIDAGLNLSTQFSINPGTQDFYGTQIPLGNGYDIGASEYASTSTPSVVITAPVNNSVVSSTIAIFASSTAASPASIVSIQFYLNGSPLGSLLTSTSSFGTYSYNWNTNGVANGSYTLFALATDNYGNSASSSPVNVVVSNAIPITVGVASGGGGGSLYTPMAMASTTSLSSTASTTLETSSSIFSTSSLYIELNSLLAEFTSLESEVRNGNISSSSSGSSSYNFIKNLSLYDAGSEVEALQQYLISQDKGPAATKLKIHGTTQIFGILTYNALVEFQKSVGIIPASGYFGSITRGWINGD